MNAFKKALADPASQAPPPAKPIDPLPAPVEDGELIEFNGSWWRCRWVEELRRWVTVRVDPPSSLSGAWFDEADEWALALALPTSFPEWEDGVDG